MHNSIWKLRPGVHPASYTSLVLILTVALATLARAADPTEELSSSALGTVYPVAQRYLAYYAGNPSPGNIHAGIDLGAPAGTSVRAVASGTVINASGGNGRLSTFSVWDGQNTVIYLHMTGLATGLLGRNISPGTVIGRVGSEGAASPHLHIEVRHGRQTLAVGPTSRGRVEDLTLDPVAYLISSAVNPIPTGGSLPGGQSASPPPATQGSAQAPPVPEYYGVFLWDGQTLQELKERQSVGSGTLRIRLQLSNVKTSNPRPSFVMFDRSLRTRIPPLRLLPLKHVVQSIGFLVVVSCQPADYWDVDNEAAIEARAAPAGENPEMARIVLVGDLNPGWYALRLGEFVTVFGVQLDAFNPATALAESFAALGGYRLQPVGTYLRQKPADARADGWECPSREVTALPGTSPAMSQTPAVPRVDRQATPTTAQDARADTPRSEIVGPAGDPLTKYPDARAYRVRHDHGSGAISTNEERWRFCEGIIYVFQDRVKFEVTETRDGARHNFEAAFADIKEVKANLMPLIRYKAFHIRLNSGQNYNFAFPGLDPAQVLAAFPATLK